MENQKMYGRSKQVIVEIPIPKKETKQLSFNKVLLLENHFYNSSTSILLKHRRLNKC